MSASGALGAPVAAIRIQGGETQVFLAVDDSLRDRVMKGLEKGKAPVEVKLEDLTTIR
jgi:hypothetical protein